MIANLVVGRSKPGCGLCPALSFKDVHHPGWGGGRAELGPASVWAGDPLLPPAFGGEGNPPAPRRRHPPAMGGGGGEGELLLRGPGAAVRPPSGRRSCRVQAAAVAGAEAAAAAGEASHRNGGCFRRRDRQCHLRLGPPALWL
jgi:hypothetical protein